DRTDRRGAGGGARRAVAGSVPAMATIEWGDFERVELRAGTIVEALDFPEARRPAYKLRVDFGPEIGVLRSSEQITEHYTADELIGRQVVGVVNFEPKQIGPIMSQVLVTGFYDDD